MPGPNSAPNGDRRLVVGYGTYPVWVSELQRYIPYDNLIWIESLKRDVVAREYFAKHGRLYTGKTENRT